MSVWYFFNEVYPPLHDGHSPLDPPAWWISLFDRRPALVEEPVENEDIQGGEATATGVEQAAAQ